MYYVYLIQNSASDEKYIGCTGDLKKRINEHNNTLSLTYQFIELLRLCVYTGREKNLITVSATLTGKRVSIIISDNGNGIPESITFENSTGFGMQLVGMLTQQIGGSIKIERVDGTRFVLEFDV